MGFLQALRHAMIDYGIRRRAWGKEAILYFNADKQTLCFVSDLKGDQGAAKADDPWNPNGEALIAAWSASDWETI